MNLVVDVGNTHTVLGRYRDSQQINRWRLRTQKDTTADELWSHWRSVVGDTLPSSLQLMVASVVPDITQEIRELARRYLESSPRILDYPWSATSVTVDTKAPANVGADRVAGAVGLHEEFGEGIIVDFGTATTLDVVASSGSYRGGVIFPGVRASAQGLSEEAVKLPHISPGEPDTFAYDDTESGLQSGLYYGTVGAVEKLVNKLKDDAGFDDETVIIGTGGGAEPFVKSEDFITHHRPDLVLEGLIQTFA